MTKIINVLSDIDTIELTLCRRGKNRKRFALSKAKEEHEMKDYEAVLKTILETPAKNEDKLETITKEMDDKGKMAVKAAMRMLDAHKGEMPDDIMERLAALLKGEAPPMPAGKPTPDKDKPVTSGPAAKNISQLPPEIQNQIKDLWKAKDEQLKAMSDAITKADEQVKEMQKKIDDQRKDMRKKELVQKAIDEMPFAPSTPEEIADMALTLEGLGDTAGLEKYLDAMKKAHEIAKSSRMFDEIGHSHQSSANNSTEKMNMLVKEIVEKSGGKISRASATSKLMDTREGKDLYTQYLDEHPEQRGPNR